MAIRGLQVPEVTGATTMAINGSNLRHFLRTARTGVIIVILLLTAAVPSLAADSIVKTIAGNGQDGFGGPEGPATEISVPQPFGLVIGPDKALYVCEVFGHVIRRINLSDGTTRVVAGNGTKGYSGDGGPATSAQLNEPYEIRFDADGHMYFVEMMNHLVRRVDAATGVITTIAGIGLPGFDGDEGQATAAHLNRPHSIVLDNTGRLFICDIGNHRIRVVDLESGLIRTFAGTGERKPTPDGAAISGTPLNGPRALDFDGDHNLFLALREGNAIWRLDLQSNSLHHVAGNGQSGYAGDRGPAKEATLSGPKGVSLAANGDLFFADTESHTIRVVRKSTQIVETVIGDGQQGNGPAGPARQCRLDRPHGVFVSADGILYVGDSSNHQVRMLKID